MSKPLERLASCTVVAVLAIACGCGAERRGRILLIGIDGASLKVARPMLRKGELPNLAKIAQQGIYGPLRSHMPIHSPRIWTSIATGKTPKSHGILGFAKDDGDGGTRLYLGSDRKGHALWNIASDAGKRVAVVNWWNTYPVETVNGVIVSDHVLAGEVQGRRSLTGASEIATGPIVYPEDWEERLLAVAEVTQPVTDVPDPFSDVSRFPEWARVERLSERYRSDERVTRIALAVDRELRPDLLMVFLPGIDRVSHRLWGALEPPADGSDGPFTPAQRDASAAALRRYYSFTDALIGELSKSFDPEDLVMVVSDHGFEAGSSMMLLTGEHKTQNALNGVIFASGPDIAPSHDKRPVTVNDVTPTILAWLGLPIGDDMQGRPASFLAVDASQIGRVASHDTRPIERPGDAPSGAEESMLEHLWSLGYVEAGDSE
jgi:predicted AlkP superfamily phosphohydrolase/phosphomutase